MDRTYSQETCEQTGRVGSVPLALNFNLCENAAAVLCAGALHGLHPMVRIDTERPVLFSGDALPMRAFAAYS